MPRYIAFLRGINLGKRRPPMSQLKTLFEELGFAGVETFIASGNLLFSTKAGDTGRLESRIAKRLESSLGYSVDTFVRPTEEVASIAQAKIFPDDDQDTVIVHVGFLQQPLPAETARKLAAVSTPHDKFRVIGREFYWLCRLPKSSDSEVWTLPEIKALRLPTLTMRNLKSLQKLVAKHIA